jgi:hypothetical protein
VLCLKERLEMSSNNDSKNGEEIIEKSREKRVVNEKSTRPMSYETLK